MVNDFCLVGPKTATWLDKLVFYFLFDELNPIGDIPNSQLSAGQVGVESPLRLLSLVKVEISQSGVFRFYH